GGLLLNAVGAWWAMYPPLFATPKKRRFDQWSMEELAAICREGPGRLVGYHPEGARNLSNDPYSLLPPHSGVGRLIYDARPQVVPVFIVGLANSLGEMLKRRNGHAERVRLRFGTPIEYEALLE